MTAAAPYGLGTRMLTLDELCEWLNITERHARKLVERNAIPYRKVGHLLRFPEAEVEAWCPSQAQQASTDHSASARANSSPIAVEAKQSILPKSLEERSRYFRRAAQ